MQETRLNTYVTLAPSPTSAQRHGLVYLDGRLYRIAGAGTSGFTNAMDVYTIATNTWTSAAAYPQGDDGFDAVALDGQIYTAGGGRPPLRR